MPRGVKVFEVRGPARRLDQELRQHQPEQHAETAEDNERPAPTVVLADQAAEESAGNGSDVDGGLMRAHRARASLSTVIVADERHGGGKVKRLAQPFGRPEEQKGAEVAGYRGHHTDDTPRLEPPEHCRLPAHSIDDVARERSANSIDQREGGAQKPELDFV